VSQALESVKGVDSAFVTFSTKTALVTAMGQLCSKTGSRQLLAALKKKRYGGKIKKIALLTDGK
jgi:hypothetical protein